VFFKRIFTWWNGATFGTLLTIAQRGRFVGQDEFGQRYYEAKTIRDGDAGRRRRWVIYKGYAEPSKVPADWHGWLHHTFVEPPTVEPFKVRAFRHALRLASARIAGPRRPSPRGDRRLRGVEARVMASQS